MGQHNFKLKAVWGLGESVVSRQRGVMPAESPHGADGSQLKALTASAMPSRGTSLPGGSAAPRRTTTPAGIYG